jgi:hypothetical protein
VFNRRRPKVDGLALSFKTPEEWLTTHAIKKSYENVVFDRKASPSEGELMGVGPSTDGKGTPSVRAHAGLALRG